MVLANDGIAIEALNTLKEAGFEVFDVQVAQSQLASYINKNAIEVLLVRSATKITQDIIAECPTLKVIGRAGVGLDNIDLVAAKKAGIKVINTPSASAKAVAELAMAHLLGGIRFLHDANRSMPLEGDTNFKGLKKAFSLGRELSNKTLGIIGFGAIGQATAKLALGMGMKVIYHDPQVDSITLDLSFFDEQSLSFTLESKTKEFVIKNSDYISLHLPSQEEYTISKEEMYQMKKGVGIINTARGSVLDTVALVEALDDEQVSFAGLDVFESEPSPEIQLLMHPKISLSPHIGGGTLEAQNRIGEELVDKIIHFYKKEKVSNNLKV